MVKYAPEVRSILRFIAGFLIWQFGAQKLLGWFGGHKMPLASEAGLAGILEFTGGILLMLGLFTRAAAFILSGLMAAAYFKAHAPKAFWPVVNQGVPAVIFCFVFLYLFFAGPGPWSFDALVRKVRN